MTNGNGDRLNSLIELIVQFDIRIQAQLQQHEERMRQHEERMQQHEERMQQHEERMQQHEERMQGHEQRIVLLEGIQADLRAILDRLTD